MSKKSSIVKGGAAGAGAGLLCEVFYGVANAVGAGPFLWIPLCGLAGIGLGEYTNKVDNKNSTKPISLISGLGGLALSTMLSPGFDFGGDDTSAEAAALSQLNAQDAYVELVDQQPADLPETITLTLAR